VPDLEWMAWTTGTAVFVAAVVLGLSALAALAVVRPSTPRKGFLPMPTARGDRIYVALLGTGLILIVLLAATSAAVTTGLAIAAVWAVVVIRWG
jgi:predicted small integral membrane protein